MDEVKIDIDDAKILKLKNWIVLQEGANLKTKAINDYEMIKKIMKKIEEEVQCNLNQ